MDAAGDDSSAVEIQISSADAAPTEQGAHSKEAVTISKKHEDASEGMLGHLPSAMEQFATIVGYPLAVVLRATVINCQEPKWRKWYWVTFFSSIVWLGIFVFLMLHMAEAAATILGIDPTVMGLTFCAAGTSAPDALASLYVAREGQGPMAIANAFGSNIFDILFGLGLPFLLSTIVNGAPLEVGTEGILQSTILLVGLLIAFLLWVSFLQCSIHKHQGWLLIVLYAVYVLMVSMKWI